LSTEGNVRSETIDPGATLKFGFMASAFWGRLNTSPEKLNNKTAAFL